MSWIELNGLSSYLIRVIFLLIILSYHILNYVALGVLGRMDIALQKESLLKVLSCVWNYRM